MIVGMGAVALQGGVVVTDDLDLWFESPGSPDFLAAVKAAGGIYIPPSIQMPPTITGRGLESLDIVMHMSGLGKFDEEYTKTLWAPLGKLKVPLLPLKRIIVSKRAAKRPKDLVILPILDDLARTLDTLNE